MYLLMVLIEPHLIQHPGVKLLLCLLFELFLKFMLRILEISFGRHCMTRMFSIGVGVLGL